VSNLRKLLIINKVVF